jgi:hypothetical protein
MHNGPFWRARPAVQAFVVAIDFVQERPAGHGEKRMLLMLCGTGWGGGRWCGCASASGTQWLLIRRQSILVLLVTAVKRPHFCQFGIRQLVETDDVTRFWGRLDSLPPLSLR